MKTFFLLCLLLFGIFIFLKFQKHETQNRIQEIQRQTDELQNQLQFIGSRLALPPTVIGLYLRQEKYFSHTLWESLIASVQSLKKLLERFPKADLNAIQSGDEQIQILLGLIRKFQSPEGLGNRDAYNCRAEAFLLKKWSGFFDRCESNPLTPAQRRACVNDDDSTLVVAGAGSGKTSTIISKCIYLINAGLARPSQILLLAYNRNAAEEMKERIQKKINGETVDVFTFHSFGNQILKKCGDHAVRVTNFVEQQDEFDRFLISVVQSLSKYDPQYKTALVEFFQNHQVPVYAESDFENANIFSAFRNSLDLRTFNREYVKSGGELRIANLLFRWRIPYAYEARYPLPVGTTSYKPDFLITDLPFDGDSHGTLFTDKSVKTVQKGAKTAWIEYFGIDKNGNVAPYVDKQKYLDSRQWKRNVHRHNGTHLIELTTGDLQNNRLESKLRQELSLLGFRIDPMSDDEFLNNLWLSNRPLNAKWQHFADLIRNFLSLYKDSGYTRDEIFRQASSCGFDMERIRRFWFLFHPVLEAYEKFNSEHHSIDFSDMVSRSCKLIARSADLLPYKYVLVDEFQDISHSRGLLLDTILNYSQNAKLFAVGDDWQSIYRFSGSDLKLFVQFERHYPKSSILQLDRTYRFSDKLHILSANFVTKNPLQFKKQMTSNKCSFVPSAVAVDVRKLWKNRHGGASTASTRQDRAAYYHEAILAYLRKIEAQPKANRNKQPSVMLLGRMTWDKMPALASTQLKKLQEQFPSLDLSYKTVHASKGLEADYVLLIGVDSNIFPSEKQSDQIIEATLPTVETYPYAEERRLFYVGMTRCKQRLVILFDSMNPSPFISELTQESSPELLTQYSDCASNIACPHCSEGHLIFHSNPDGSKKYYQCCNPFCHDFFSCCPQCGSPLVQNHEGQYCLNKECTFVEIRCPVCGTGFLKKRLNSRNGTVFYGCSSWRSNGPSCSGILQEKEAERQLTAFKSDIQAFRRKIPKQTDRPINNTDTTIIASPLRQNT